MINFEAVFANTKHKPYWLDTIETSKLVLPHLETDVREYTCIIGAGFTGAMTALKQLKSKGWFPGRGVVLIDHGLADSSSIKSGGVIFHGNEYPSRLMLTEPHELETEKQIHAAIGVAISDLESIIHSASIDCDIEMGGAIIGQREEYHREMLINDIQSRAGKYNDKIQYLDKQDFAKYLSTPAYYGGAYMNAGGVLNPAKLLIGLHEGIRKKGGKLFSGKALRFQTMDRGDFTGKICVVVENNGNKVPVICENLVIATNAYVSAQETAANSMDKIVVPIHTYALSTAPLSDEQLKGLSWKKGASLTDSAPNFNWMRMADNRIIAGGHTSYLPNGAAPPSAMANDNYKQIYSELIRVFPQLNGISVEHAWNGRIAENKVSTPFVYWPEKENMMCSSAAGMQGIWFSVIAGRSMAGRALRKAPVKPEYNIFCRVPEENPKDKAAWHEAWSELAKSASSNKYVYELYEKYMEQCLR